MTNPPPLTLVDAARAADGLDRANRFVKQALVAFTRVDPGPDREVAKSQLTKAEAGVRYAALVLRSVEDELGLTA